NDRENKCMDLIDILKNFNMKVEIFLDYDNFINSILMYLTLSDDYKDKIYPEYSLYKFNPNHIAERILNPKIIITDFNRKYLRRYMMNGKDINIKSPFNFIIIFCKARFGPYLLSNLKNIHGKGYIYIYKFIDDEEYLICHFCYTDL